MKLNKVIALLTLDSKKHAKRIAETLLKYGFNNVEVTFRSDEAPAVIQEMSQVNNLIVGAGTVTTIDQVKTAVLNGAQFIITPGINHSVIKYCVDNNIPVFPGVVTPTEIMTCKEYGLSTLKLFPASVFGGKELLKALYGPFKDIQFIPTGGITLENLQEYLNLPNVQSVAGSFVVNAKYVKNEEWDLLEQQIKEVSERVY